MQLKDFTTDEGLVFLLPLKEAGVIPEWVQEVLETSDVEGLPSTAFADPNNRLMPLHTKAATWLSAVSSYAYDHPHGCWVERLKSACHAYGIMEPVKAAIEVLRPEAYQPDPLEQKEKTAHAIELVVHEGEEPTPFYNISNPYHIETSAGKLAADIGSHRLPGAWLQDAAVALVKAANEQGVSSSLLPSIVRELGEDRLPSPSYIERQLELRKEAGLSDDAITLYGEIAKQALDGEIEREDAILYWELADRNFGLETHEKLATPVRVFNSGELRSDVEKMAASVVLIDDVPVPMAALQTLPTNLVVGAFPKEAAARILSACAAEDGRSAGKVLNELEREHTLTLMSLLTQSYAD